MQMSEQDEFIKATQEKQSTGKRIFYSSIFILLLSVGLMISELIGFWNYTANTHEMGLFATLDTIRVIVIISWLVSIIVFNSNNEKVFTYLGYIVVAIHFLFIIVTCILVSNNVPIQFSTNGTFAATISIVFLSTSAPFLLLFWGVYGIIAYKASSVKHAKVFKILGIIVLIIAVFISLICVFAIFSATMYVSMLILVIPAIAIFIFLDSIIALFIFWSHRFIVSCQVLEKR